MVTDAFLPLQTLDDPSDQCYPKVIDSLKGFRAVGVSAGHRHRLVQSAEHDVFAYIRYHLTSLQYGARRTRWSVYIWKWGKWGSWAW